MQHKLQMAQVFQLQQALGVEMTPMHLCQACLQYSVRPSNQKLLRPLLTLQLQLRLHSQYSKSMHLTMLLLLLLLPLLLLPLLLLTQTVSAIPCMRSLTPSGPSPLLLLILPFHVKQQRVGAMVLPFSLRNLALVRFVCQIDGSLSYVSVTEFLFQSIGAEREWLPLHISS
jgi:hypothetical protein